MVPPMMEWGFLAVGALLLVMAAAEWRSGRALVGRFWWEPVYVTREESRGGFGLAVGSKAGTGTLLVLIGVLSLVAR